MGRKQEAEGALFDQTNLLPKKQLIVVFSVLATSLLVCFIDQNGIGTILPQVARDLHAESTISWAGTSALIANTVFQVLYGRFSDLFGRKSVYLSALLLLAISDLLCGLSQNATMLYVFRGLAGVANGGITSLTMMIVSDVVTLEQRGKYQGILGSMIGLGNTLGPLLGALFAERATWRALFWFICPVCVLCAVVDWYLLPSTMPTVSVRDTIGKIDIWGLITGSLAVILLLIPISGGGSYFEWDSPMVIAMLAVGGVLALGFVLVEWKIAKLPMMPLYIWKNVPVAALLTQNFFFGLVYYSYTYYIPLYYQNARGYSPIISAVMTIPMVIAQSLVSILSGQYISRRKRYGEVIWSGFGLWLLGSGLTLLFNRTLHPAAMVVILVIIGSGVGNVFQPTLVALQAHCTKQQRAVIISNRNFLRSLGGAVGLAISAAILQNTLKRKLPADLVYLAASSYAFPDISQMPAEKISQIRDAYVAASRAVFITNVPFMAVCFLGCLLIKDRGLTRPDEMPQAGTAQPSTSAEDSENAPEEAARNSGDLERRMSRKSET